MTEQAKILKKGNIGILLVLIATLSYSIEGIAAKFAYQGGATVLTALVFRYLMAAAIYWSIVLITKQNFRLPFGQLVKLLAFAACTQGVAVVCLFYSFSYIPAAMSILFLYLYPTIVTLLAYFLLKEPLTANKIAALVLTLVGSAVILGQPVNNLDPRGVAFAVVAAVFNAIYIIGGAKFLQNLSVLILNTYMTSALAVVFTAGALFSGTLTLKLNFSAWTAIFSLAVVCTVIATFCFFHGVSLIGASRTAIVSTSEPLLTAILGFIFLNEKLTLLQMLGGLLVIVGVFLQREKSPPRKVERQGNLKQPGSNDLPQQNHT